MASRLYYDPAKPSAFATLQKLRDSVGQSTSKQTKNMARSDIKKWLEKQDAYTLHTSVRKRFHRNPYNVTNIDDVWECDQVDVYGLSKYNDGVRYLLTVIEVFFFKFCISCRYCLRRAKLSLRHFSPSLRTRNIRNLYDDAPSGYARIRGRNF